MHLRKIGWRFLPSNRPCPTQGHHAQAARHGNVWGTHQKTAFRRFFDVQRRCCINRYAASRRLAAEVLQQPPATEPRTGSSTTQPSRPVDHCQFAWTVAWPGLPLPAANAGKARGSLMLPSRFVCPLKSWFGLALSKPQAWWRRCCNCAALHGQLQTSALCAGASKI